MGKGGVGKTTTAAASAIRSAELGYRTLVVSTDIAHSLADSLDMPLTGQPQELIPNLFAQEINVLDEVREHWGEMQGYLGSVLRKQGMSKAVAEEMAIIPGMEEVVSLLHINKQANEDNFDRVIIDAAPTGETIRLLTVPESFQWYVGRLRGWGDMPMRMAINMVSRFMPDKDLMGSLDNLVAGVKELQKVLTNPEITSYRVVLNPEKMVIKEAQRAYTYLNLYGYSVDAVVCNRVFPRDLSDGYFDIWKSAQAANLQLVNECFHPLPIFEVPLFDQEVTGLAMLQRMADTVFGPDPVRDGPGDPTRKFYVGKPQEITRNNGYYVLSIPLPLAEREDVNLHRSVYDELIVRIGNWKRNVVLPTGLAKLDVSGARYEGDRLNILFEVPPATVIAPEDLKPKRWDTLKARLRGK